MREQTIEDEVLGTLTWNKSVNCWGGETEIMPGHTISVTVLAEDTPLATVLEGARPLFQRLRADEPALRQAAADGLLARYNSTWNDGPPLDSATFMAQIALNGFAAYEDGSAEINYDDGDLFWGHTITVSIDANGAFQDVGING